MKKFNRKQRAEIYLKAAMLHDEDGWIMGMCSTIKTVTGNGEIYRTHYAHEIYPEFFLLKPEITYDGYWFDGYEDGDKDIRVLILLFAHQIALNP